MSLINRVVLSMLDFTTNPDAFRSTRTHMPSCDTSTRQLLKLLNLGVKDTSPCQALGAGQWTMWECVLVVSVKSNLTNQTNPPVEDTSSERGTGESPQTTKPDCRSVLVKSIRDIEQIWDHPVILRLQIYLFWCFRLVRVKYLNVSEVVFVCVRILWIVFRYLHQVTSLVGAALGRSINVFILFFVCITLLVVVRLVTLDLSKLKCLLCALDNNSILSENYWNFQYNVICIH